VTPLAAIFFDAAFISAALDSAFALVMISSQGRMM
jgi:hypothetical protein